MEGNENHRQSRFKRAAFQKGLVLQERDLSILKAVFEYRYLKRSQIQRLFAYDCTTRVNIRLRKLYDHKYLDRHFQPMVVGSSEAIYTIGIKGAQVIGKLLSLDAAEIKRRRRLDNIAKDRFIEHNLTLNDFRINLMTQLKKNLQFQFRRWLDSRDCEYKFKYWANGKEMTTSLKPDGYFEFVHQTLLYSFFVEIDLSTSGQSKLQSKFKNYIQFKDLNLYQKEFGKENFHVLVVTNSLTRCERLHGIANKLNSSLFWFSTLSETKSDLLFGDIWTQSLHTQMRAFFSQSKVKVLA